MHLRGKKNKDGGDFDDNSSSIGSVNSLRQRNNSFNKFRSQQTKEDADPGVVSEDEFTFDDLSHKSSGSSLNQPPPSSEVVNSSSVIAEEIFPTVNTDNNIMNNKANTLPHIRSSSQNDRKPQDEWESKLFGRPSKSIE